MGAARHADLPKLHKHRAARLRTKEVQQREQATPVGVDTRGLARHQSRPCWASGVAAASLDVLFDVLIAPTSRSTWETHSVAAGAALASSCAGMLTVRFSPVCINHMREITRGPVTLFAGPASPRWYCVTFVLLDHAETPVSAPVDLRVGSSNLSTVLETIPYRRQMSLVVRNFSASCDITRLDVAMTATVLFVHSENIRPLSSILFSPYEAPQSSHGRGGQLFRISTLTRQLRSSLQFHAKGAVLNAVSRTRTSAYIPFRVDGRSRARS